MWYQRYCDFVSVAWNCGLRFHACHVENICGKSHEMPHPSMLSRKGHLPSAFFISTSVHGGSLGDGKMVFKARIRGNIVEEFFWLREAVFIPGFIQPTEKAMAPHSCTLGLENPMDRGAW